MQRLWISFSSIDSFEGNVVTWEIAEVVVIVEHFQDRIQWLSLEGQGLSDHSINSLAANDGVVPQIVVVSLEQEGQLACFLR